MVFGTTKLAIAPPSASPIGPTVPLPDLCVLSVMVADPDVVKTVPGVAARVMVLRPPSRVPVEDVVKFAS